ncbi:MAG: hypothetical protein F4Z55_04805 [Boseongicola sp. SB0667_bin_21]|nr:hypothetical protein [Boseongicola sp. SB0667_bin_21]
MSLNRGRPVYCRDPADWERIRKRAASVGVSVSEFVMTCALHDVSPEPPPPLVLTPEEQRELLANVRELQRRVVGIFLARADGGPPMVEAVQLLYQLENGELPFDMRDPESGDPE